MRETKVFLGNEICCGTYAFLNTVQDKEIDCKIFEITSSVPFGIRHRRESDYSRLLTTYCDPNTGIDRAAELWGYKQNKVMFFDAKTAVKYILEKSKTDRCLVGPLDMGRLNYLALPNLYANMDHYITIYRDDEVLLCMDSEGIPVRRTNKEELEKWLWVGELPEAEGRINVRSYEKTDFYFNDAREGGAIRDSLKLITNNLMEARENGQGSYAIEKCWQWLQEKSVKKWRLSFLYDIGFLTQRKILQQYWCGLVSGARLLDNDIIRESEGIIRKQIRILGSMFHGLWRGNTIYEQDFTKLAELEKELSIKLNF